MEIKKDTTKMSADVADENLFDNWFDPIETELRTKVRGDLFVFRGRRGSFLEFKFALPEVF